MKHLCRRVGTKGNENLIPPNPPLIKGGRGDFQKKKIYIILIIIGLLSLSCGGKDEIKPSVDSVMTQEALKVINALKRAYQEKNKDVLKKNLDSTFAESTLRELLFEKAELSFSPQIVNINVSIVKVNLNWQGIWIVKGKKLKNMGTAVFVFEGSPMKLIRIEGDNPFRIPLVKD